MNNPTELVEEKTTLHCICDACRDGVIHNSDCAVHSMPAKPNGQCDCEPKIALFSEDLSLIWSWAFGEDWVNNQATYKVYLAVTQELALQSAESKRLVEEAVNKIVLVRDRLDATIASGRGNNELCEAFNDICDLVDSLTQPKEGV